MHFCTIKIDGCAVAFKALRDLVPAFRQFAATPAFLDFEISPGITTGGYRICYEEKKKVTIQYSDKTATVCGPWNRIREGEVLLYAALPFIELQRQRKGFVTAHAAAVALPKGAALILGKEGSGKTTTALGLCQSYGAKLIGNDLVVVGAFSNNDRITIRGGTKFLHLRYESICRNMPDLLSLFPPRDEDSWLRKVIVSPSHANIGVRKGTVPLGGVFLIHVDETKDTLFTTSADTAVTRLYLNENFSRYIRGTCIALLGDKLEYLGYVPSLDSDSLFAKRIALMDRLLIEHSMMYVSGPLSRVVSYIASKCKGRGP